MISIHLIVLTIIVHPNRSFCLSFFPESTLERPGISPQDSFRMPDPTADFKVFFEKGRHLMLHPILHPVIEQRLTFNCVGELTFPKFILVLNMTNQKPTLLITLNKTIIVS